MTSGSEGFAFSHNSSGSRSRCYSASMKLLLSVLVFAVVGCVSTAPHVPVAGPRAVAWIDAYTEAVLSGLEENEAIEFANGFARTRQAGETK